MSARDVAQPPSLLSLAVVLALAIPAARSFGQGPPSPRPMGTYDFSGCYGAPVDCVPEGPLAAAIGPRSEAQPAGCSRKLDIRAALAKTKTGQGLRLAQSSGGRSADSDPFCQQPGVTCVDLSQRLASSSLFATSVVWDLQNQGLVMPCLLERRLVHYGRSSGQGEVVLDDLWNPALIRRHHDDFVVELGDGFLQVFTEERVRQEIDLKRGRNETWKIASVRDWHITHRAVFAFVELTPRSCPSGQPEPCLSHWRFGLVRFEREPDPEFVVLWSDELDSDAKYYTTLLNSYITEARGEIYAFLPGRPSRLLKAAGSRSVPSPLPTEISRAIAVQGFDRRDAARLYQDVGAALASSGESGSIFPARLIGWQGELYLLYRGVGAGGNGPVRWWLAQLDPQDRPEVRGSIQVPTDSPRILLAPGREQWAVVEHPRVGPDDTRGVHRPSRLKLWSYRAVEYAFTPSGIEARNSERVRRAQRSGT